MVQVMKCKIIFLDFICRLKCKVISVYRFGCWFMLPSSGKGLGGGGRGKMTEASSVSWPIIDRLSILFMSLLHLKTEAVRAFETL
jgi:hypothetical protein